MTADHIEALGPAFAAYLEQFLFCCGYSQTFDLLGVYCRGLLSDLDRKTCEPIALHAGVAVRTLQEFLRDQRWSFAQAREVLQRHVAATLPEQAGDDLGTVGVVDETGTAKKGRQTPGVQRQWCGAVGKQESCIVTVHLGVAKGRYKTLVDADLFLPESWDKDRDRCRKAGIPEDVGYRPKWQLALGQLDRAGAQGIALDWLTFDEGYGDKPGFWAGLERRRLRAVGEVPRSWRCFARRPRRGEAGHRADDLVRHSPAFRSQRWRVFRLRRQTLGDQEWEAKAAQVWLSAQGRPTARTYGLIWARNRRTGEEKYFVSNAAPRESPWRLLRVAFRRWNVEHAFRLSKGEIGFCHFEGRSYVGLMRHLVLCLVTLTFAAGQAGRLRGEKPGADAGAGLPGAEPAVRRLAGGAAGDGGAGAHGGGHRLSPEAESGGPAVAAAPPGRPARGIPARAAGPGQAAPLAETTSEAVFQRTVAL
jgi:SRSO17 transposase